MRALAITCLLAGCGLTLDFDPPEADAGRRDGGREAGRPDVDGPDVDGPDVDGVDAHTPDSGEHDADPDVGICSTDAECDPGQFCDETMQCRDAVCGNHAVEGSGEECDDGNLDEGDGCDNDCRWSCGGERPCGERRGCVAERCLDHLCVPVDTVGDLCGTGAVCTSTGVCTTCGNGMLDPGEECDSGDPADTGCVDCRYPGCATNLDCDDCERCVGHACEPITVRMRPCDGCFLGGVAALDLDGVGSPGCAALCPDLVACDCNDADPSIYYDPEGIHGCGPMTERVECGTDADGDSFVGSEIAIYDDSCPAGLEPVTRRDCYDENDEANPNATRPRSTPRGDESFDWNCDGRETPSHRERATLCRTMGGGCAGSGWVVRVPACGARGLWNECARVGSTCEARRSFRNQSCL